MPRQTRILTILTALLLAVACLPAAAQGSLNPIGTYRTSDGLGTEYRDTGASIANVETVKRIPFFNLDGTTKAQRFSTYGTTLKEGNFKGAATALKQDFSTGLFKDLTTIFLTDILTKVARGQDLNEAISASVKGMASKEFLAGNLLGGTLGAMLGSAIPVPAIGGMMGSMAGTLPMLAGAMLGTRVGINLINGRDPFNGINPLEFACQAIGSTVGMVLGGMLPVPTLGPIVGGAIGGTMGVKFAAWLQQNVGDLIQKHRGGTETLEVVTPVAAPVAAPQAPQTSTDLAGLDASSLRKMSDGFYREYLKASASNDRTAATASLASYKQVQEALGGHR
jgi:hypothetical protein